MPDDLDHMPDLIEPLLEALPEEARQTRVLERGEFLFRQSEPARAIFLVSSGRVRMFRDLADGSSVTLHVARDGETFAEAALFANEYHCHAQAELSTAVITIDTEQLLNLMSTDAALALQLSRQFAAQVRELRAMLSLRDIRSADERLLTWLRRKVDQETMALTLDRPWSAISEELGLTREAVYRSLGKLQSQGLLEREGRHSDTSTERIRLRPTGR